jgi:tetratricopeptide (TPR) repeat protein
MSNNQKMYTRMARLFEGMNNYFLGKQYSFENSGRNLGNVPLLELACKIVIIVDKSNSSFMENKDFKEALKWVDKAIELDAENPFYYNNKGLYLIYVNQLDLALENINYSIKLFPKNDYALRNKGIYFYYQKEYETANKYLTDVFQKYPEMEMVREYLSKIKEMKQP